MSWPRDDEGTDPHYREIPVSDDAPTKLDESQGRAVERAFLATIQEHTESIDGRVERLDRHILAHHEAMRVLLQQGLSFARWAALGAAMLGFGFLGVASAAVLVAAIR